MQGVPLLNYPFSLAFVMRGSKELISVNECIVSLASALLCAICIDATNYVSQSFHCKCLRQTIPFIFIIYFCHYAKFIINNKKLVTQSVTCILDIISQTYCMAQNQNKNPLVHKYLTLHKPPNICSITSRSWSVTLERYF